MNYYTVTIVASGDDTVYTYNNLIMSQVQTVVARWAGDELVKLTIELQQTA